MNADGTGSSVKGRRRRAQKKRHSEADDDFLDDELVWQEMKKQAQQVIFKELNNEIHFRLLFFLN